MSIKTFSQIIDKTISQLELNNVSNVANDYKMPVSKDVILLPKKKDNKVLVTGTMKGYTFDKPHTFVIGVEDARFTGTIVIEANTTFSNCIFDIDNDVLVRITSGKVLFDNCTFIRRHDSDDTINFIQIESGAKATFSSCRFRSEEDDGVMDGAGIVIDNANPGNFATLVGGANETGWNMGTTQSFGILG